LAAFAFCQQKKLKNLLFSPRQVCIDFDLGLLIVACSMVGFSAESDSDSVVSGSDASDDDPRRKS